MDGIRIKMQFAIQLTKELHNLTFVVWQGATQSDIRTSGRALHNQTFVNLEGRYTTRHSYLWQCAT